MRASSGIPSVPQASTDCGIAEPPVHRLDRADVEVLAGVAGRHDRELLGREVELAAAAGAEQGDQPERLDRRAQVDDPVRVADEVEHPPRGVDLDDVPAVDGLDDAVAHLAHEDRRHGPLRRARGPALPGGGARRRDASGVGSTAMAPRIARRRAARCSRRRRAPALGSRPHPAARRPPPHQRGTPWRPGPTSTSRSTPRCATSSRILRDERPSPRSSARSCASCRGCWATRRSPTRGRSRSRSRRRSRRWPARSWRTGSA